MSKTNVLLPPATIGIIGGGQLGQMIAFAAKRMGYKVGVLDPTPHAPAGQVSDFQIVADYDDQAAVDELTAKSDVLTYEFENVSLETLANVPAEKLPQGTELLNITGDRFHEKSFLHNHGIPTVPFAPVNDDDSFQAAVDTIGLPAIIKTRQGGYDGHGQLDVNSKADFGEAKKMYDSVPCILEGRLDFIKEASVMVTRTAAGVIRVFPVSENQHQDHILHLSIVPARVTDTVAKAIDDYAREIAKGLTLFGVLGIECFITADDKVVINELAPRPHNSGHYSIEACNISQFEAHVRSICGLPIPEIKQIQPAVMINLLGDELLLGRKALIDHPDWHFHEYGKAEIRPKRKLGHITLTGPDLDKLITDAKAFERQANPLVTKD